MDWCLSPIEIRYGPCGVIAISNCHSMNQNYQNRSIVYRVTDQQSSAVNSVENQNQNQNQDW